MTAREAPPDEGHSMTANRWLALAIYIAVALMWLVPDRRIESHLQAH